MSLTDSHNTLIEPAVGARKRPLISVCTPAYDEEANIEACYEAVKAFFATEPGYDWEWVVTDNHSTDGTFGILREIARRDARVRGVRFSRNFGYQRSILAGYMHARGDAAVQLDCDLEDPPAVIAQFLRLWEGGHQVAYGVRRSRPEAWAVRTARRVFYWGLDKISEDRLPRDVGDFRLIDRRVIEELRRVQDPHLYIRGRVAAMGFKQAGVPYDRDARRAGKTKFNFWRLCSLALDATLSHSVVPLRIATFMGLAMCGGTLLLIAGYAVARFFGGVDWPAGFTTLVVLILFATGVNGLFLGIIGEYLARIYQHLKGTTGVIVEETTPGPGVGIESFVAQGDDGVEARRLDRGEHAEDHARSR